MLKINQAINNLFKKDGGTAIVDMAHAGGKEAAKPRVLEQKWRILITVMVGLFMIILDSTIVNIAFPTLRSEFGATLSAWFPASFLNRLLMA